MLIGKYIPNLIAKPFDISRDYAQIIYDQTSSPKLDRVLRNWDEENWDSSDKRQQLAYIILVELLAFQFASPVRRIQTQDLLFTHYNFHPPHRSRSFAYVNRRGNADPQGQI